MDDEDAAMTERRDTMPFHYDAKIREILDGQAQQTAELIAVRTSCEKIEARMEALDERTDAHETELSGNRKVARVAAWGVGVFGSLLVGGIATYITTTIRLEERQGAAERALEAVQVRHERESAETRKTLESVREALVELRTEQRANGQRLERIERAATNEVRRRR